jgi:hypothetical protein
MGGDDAPRAHAAIQRALDLAPGHTTAVERAMIEAMAVRYEPVHDAERRASLDTAYQWARAEVYERFSSDLEVGTLYAESLMLLEPRCGTWDIGKRSVLRIHHILEEVLSHDLSHPGACHLYVHATESTTRPDKAEACADLLGDPIYMSICFGAVLGGAVFGDQCSPISDTTILSALACGGDVMDHVTTQLPLALAAAGLGAVASTLFALAV